MDKTPATCPHCGQTQNWDTYRDPTFRCNSDFRNGKLYQSDVCKISVLSSGLVKAIEVLQSIARSRSAVDKDKLKVTISDLKAYLPES